MRLTPKLLNEYAQKCRIDGQSEETIKVKIRNLQILFDFCADSELSAELMAGWRVYIMERFNKPHSRNNMVCKTNVFLDYLGLSDFKIKSFYVKRHKFHSMGSDGISADDFKQMLAYTEKKNKRRANLLLRVLATTGIRSGEVRHITVEAVDVGYASFVHHKKPQKVLLPEKLRERLRDYANMQSITTGPLFITRNGNLIHQRSIGSELKKIAEKVNIPKDKISPTTLRLLFANA